MWVVAHPTKLVAPPLTRGSTAVGRRHNLRIEGSPAHAGIDPSGWPWPACSRRLPRSRGDRPRRSASISISSWAPPLTRGSTRKAHVGRGIPEGSPAHAGIDLLFRLKPVTGSGLPRSRGDRPSFDAAIYQWATAPPLTRGSTFARRAGGCAGAGSPAHAGIDPDERRDTPVPRWLPRSRGDRPEMTNAIPDVVRAPPLTRGSTPSWAAPRIMGAGSPAHAGIDLGCAEPAIYIRRLPRSRGDRP